MADSPIQYPVPAAPTVPSAHVHALHLLRSKGLRVKEVVRVDPDSILYLDARDQPMTAWVQSDETGTKVEVRYEPGFPAEPTNGLILAAYPVA